MIYSHQKDFRAQNVNAGNIKNIAKIQFVVRKSLIVWMKVFYRTRAGSIIETSPMGTQFEGNFTEDDIEQFFFEAEDQIRSIYTGFDQDVITFLKFTTLRQDNVASVGLDVYDVDGDDQEKTLSPLESVVGMRAVFKKNFDWSTRQVPGKRD